MFEVYDIMAVLGIGPHNIGEFLRPLLLYDNLPKSKAHPTRCPANRGPLTLAGCNLPEASLADSKGWGPFLQS